SGPIPEAARPLGRRPNVRSFRWIAWMLGSVIALSTIGCGPAFYLINIAPASRALSEAEQANAAEHAPYEFYYAQAMFRKAKEEDEEASYQDAIHYAEIAEEFGTKARDLARRHMREMGR